MDSDWSQAIRREYAGGEARFGLPVRPLGWGRLMGVFLVGFGLLFVWSPAKGLFETMDRFSETSQPLFESTFLVAKLFFLVAGSIPLVIGLLILFGRCRVEWKEGRLRVSEMLGPLRWTRRLPFKPVRKLAVSAATSKSGSAPPCEMAQFASLTAEFDDGTKKLIVLGYPKQMLLGLAQELRTYVGGGALSAAAVEVEVTEKAATEESDDDLEEQPAGSQVQVEERGAGVRLVVPPAGIWRGSKGLVAFALFWCGFMAVFTGISVFASSKDSVGIPVAFWVFIPAFWLIGLGLLAGAVNMGRRSATLEADGGRLRVETRGLLGTKELDWTRADLSAIRADASGMTVNDQPVLELQVHPRTGKKVGLLAGRKEEELRWMATRLRRALGLPNRASD